MGENTKTLQELIKTPQTQSTVKLRPHVMAHAYSATITADPGAQETALHQAYYSNANPDNRKRHSKPPKTLINAYATLTTTQDCSLSLTKLNKYI